jgi:predicted aldo/keto reductase-like oxidoreductase
MHYRTLGNTGLSVSVLGLGSSPFRHSKPNICADLICQAIDSGITYYDTARSYVNGEETVAQLPTAYKQQVVIATKTGARFGRRCLEDLQRSLRTMKTDRVDIWMTHMLRTAEEYELCTELGGFCDIAIAARDAGLIRATGASFHAPTELILRAIEERAFDIVMFQLNLIGRETVFGSSIESYREILLPAARANGVGVVVMKVLAGGELQQGAPRLNFSPEADDCRGSIASAVRYATMHPYVGTAVVGMGTSDELLLNVMAVEGVDDRMLPEFLRWTGVVRDKNRGECTRCGLCLDVCPEGIHIPKVFRIYDQHRFFGMEGVAQFRYSELERDASYCVRCRECQKVCPEEFDIGQSLDAAHNLLRPKRMNAIPSITR